MAAPRGRWSGIRPCHARGRRAPADRAGRVFTFSRTSSSRVTRMHVARPFDPGPPRATTPRSRWKPMSFNTFGHLFRVTTFGESHGPAIGCVVDGCPPGIPLTEADIQPYLDKRRPGQSRFTTQRQEPDQVRILSGVFKDERDGRAGHHRHADRAADRERRPALEGLFRHQRQIPARPRRLHLRRQIRPARLSRRRPRSRRARPRCGSRPARSRARSCRA